MKIRLLLLLIGILLPFQIATAASEPEYPAEVTFTLRTAVAEGKLVYIGQGGNIDGQVNPTLRVPENAVVQVNLINGDGAMHDVVADAFGTRSDRVTGRDASTVMVFRTGKAGEFRYWCSVPGHRAAGMEGLILVGKGASDAGDKAADLSHPPTDIPPAIGDRPPRDVSVDLHTTEKTGHLADGTRYKFWTFNDQVPGPFLRVRQGDRVTVNLHNDKTSTMVHSVDFHAVTGPGGGAEVTQAAPGKTASFRFRALKPGLYVYHCATPMVAHHITNGMYGLILVEPAGGLAKVDREFYVMQGEIYTTEVHGQHGDLSFSLDKLLNERPEYYIFNGASDALTKTHRMEARVGETVRIFFGVGGPNATSSFHVIGEMFDRVYHEGSLISPPMRDVQTTTVAPGGATMVEFKVDFPGRYILVDHALSRMERGLVGFLHVNGKADKDIFEPLAP